MHDIVLVTFIESHAILSRLQVHRSQPFPVVDDVGVEDSGIEDDGHLSTSVIIRRDTIVGTWCERYGEIKVSLTQKMQQNDGNVPGPPFPFPLPLLVQHPPFDPPFGPPLGDLPPFLLLLLLLG